MKFVSLSLKVVFMPVCRREVSLEAKEGREQICLSKDQKTIYFFLVTEAIVIYIYEEDYGKTHVISPLQNTGCPFSSSTADRRYI